MISGLGVDVHWRSLTFFGLVFADEGIKPNPVKIKAICHLEGLKDTHEARSFLGMVTYCVHFFPSGRKRQNSYIGSPRRI